MTAAPVRRLHQTVLRCALLGAMAQLGLGLEPAMASDGFTVGAGDRLSITVHRRADLSGEFRVLPGGALSLPFLGNLGVGGKSLEEVQDVVAQRLRDDAALLDPRVSVGIVEMQPIFVTGLVRRPGQHPFHLGMTVGHALAIAGGLRQLDLEEVGAHIEIIRLRERLRLSQDSYGLALIRQARWAAELRDAQAFDLPNEAARYLAQDRLQQAYASEQQLLEGRNANSSSLLAMIAAQTAALNDELQALRENSVAKEQEQALLQQETRYVDNLMRQGLTPRTSRVIELSRLAVQVDGERRQLLAFMARARQEIARIEHTRANAAIQRRMESSAGLKEAEDQLTTLRVTLQETRAGLAQLRETVGLNEGPAAAHAARSVVILRNRTTPPQRIDADGETPLLPGDLIDFTPDSPGSNRLVSGIAR